METKGNEPKQSDEQHIVEMKGGEVKNDKDRPVKKRKIEPTHNGQRVNEMKDWIKIVVMPILIVILTAFLGIFLQNRSFKRNTLFQAKLNQIISGRNEAVELLQDVDKVRRRIRAAEDYFQREIDRIKITKSEDLAKAMGRFCEEKMQFLEEGVEAPLQILRQVKIRTIAIEDFTKAFDNNNAINETILDFNNKLGDFIGCLQSNDCIACSDKHENIIPALRNLISAHTRMISELLEENK